MSEARAYLDWNATAPLLAAARQAMVDALALTGNPSSVHAEGRAARALIEQARAGVARLAGVPPAQVVFTSGATEAANHLLTPDYRNGRTPLSAGPLLVGASEHPCILRGGRFRAEDVARVPVDRQGRVDLDRLAAMLAEIASDGTKRPIIAIQWANNETGVIQPVREAAECASAHNGIVVVDAVQGAGRLPMSMAALGADFLILSAHKIGGPKGVGAVVAAGETLMPAAMIGGGGQEHGHRAGTENLAAIAGFGAAAEVAAEAAPSFAADVEPLRQSVEAQMTALAPDVVIHGAGAPRIANTIAFSLPSLRAETALIGFDLEGVAVSAGSACSSGKVGRSHVLEAMGADAETGSIRMSFGATTTQAEMDRFVAAFAKIASRRRRVQVASLADRERRAAAESALG